MRVASVPAGHPYVRHLPDPDGGDGVVRLGVDAVAAEPPPAAFAPAWVIDHAATFDVLHLHFALTSSPPADLAAAVEAMRATARALVVTVHDLESPQVVDQTSHLAGLDVLVPAADALVTLSPAAAAAIEARWGRRADVIPHPHLLPLDAPVPDGSPSIAKVVGVHLGDLRANVDGPGTVVLLREAVAGLRAAGLDVVGRVTLDDHTRDDLARDAVRAVCAAAPGLLELRERPRPDDVALHEELASIDVVVLPYVHGTHSGWLELCWDLAVPVATPPVGAFLEQHPEPGACAAFAPGVPASLEEVLADLLALGVAAGTSERIAAVLERRAIRLEQRRAIAAAHRALYDRVIGLA